MEPLAILAGAVTMFIIPKALEKVGEKLGESAIQSSNQLLGLTLEAVSSKLKNTGTIELLRRAKQQPNELNIQILEAEILNQMNEDEAFAARLDELIDQLQAQSPSLQIVLDEVRIRGNATIGNISQKAKGNISAHQVVGRNLGVVGDFKAGDINQNIQD